MKMMLLQNQQIDLLLQKISSKYLNFSGLSEKKSGQISVEKKDFNSSNTEWTYENEDIVPKTPVK